MCGVPSLYLPEQLVEKDLDLWYDSCIVDVIQRATAQTDFNPQDMPTEWA
jgi:hypothetical protein